ncbi:hypothetical protein [uncultured Brevundimonas sp.]|uniref:hypothetical protein n=1 Tax=uncultured Brevundimonas sp. TaxID=213418 RepID=UPI0025CE70A8|nr:hypothetical protein [uncultured Brevundimonas sp.]
MFAEADFNPRPIYQNMFVRYKAGDLSAGNVEVVEKASAMSASHGISHHSRRYSGDTKRQRG